MGKQRPGILIYWEMFDVLERLNPEQAQSIILAIRQYAQNGQEPTFDSNSVLAIVWPIFAQKIDSDKERYIDRCKKATAAINTRWGKPADTRVYERIPNIPTTTTTTTTSSTATERNVGQLARAPTIEEIKRYCSEQGIKTDERHFFDYYSARSWANISDWRAALRSWAARDQQYGRQPQQEEPRLQRLF